MLEVLHSTGARISEAVGLDVDDIDTYARSVAAGQGRSSGWCRSVVRR
jgi:integrase/recombinase XerD